MLGQNPTVTVIPRLRLHLRSNTERIDRYDSGDEWGGGGGLPRAAFPCAGARWPHHRPPIFAIPTMKLAFVFWAGRKSACRV